MINLQGCSLADFYSPALQQDKVFVSIAKALDPQLQKFVSQIPRVIIYPNVAGQSEAVIDFLALWDRPCDYYDTSLPIAAKLQLLNNVIRDKLIKGTPQAIINLLSSVFQYAEVIEWFNDKPPALPNTFRINIADHLVDPVKVAAMVRAILIRKNVRSYFAGISSFSHFPGTGVITSCSTASYSYQLVSMKPNVVYF